MTQAITLAQEDNLPVHFLYVVSRELMSDTALPNTNTAVEELRQMGSSMVLVAQAIANSHGIPAQGAVRYGYVEDEIAELCQDLDADYLVLSQPHGRGEIEAFTPERLARFHARIERETRARVILAGKDGL
jgi:nucleotide-binding universal stress UspA family protein